MEEKLDGMFNLNGIVGMLIATVLLLCILGYLGVYKAITVQQKSIGDAYVINGSAVAQPKTKADIFANLQEVKMFDTTAQSRVDSVK